MTNRFLLSLCLFGGTIAGPLPSQPAELAPRVGAALSRARPKLMARLRRARNGELALLCLAAIHDEVKPSDQHFAKALRRLQQTRLSATYDIALRLMVAAECRAFPQRQSTASRDAVRLVKHINRRNGFGYAKDGRGWDLSNTQYAVLGLRAAASLGVVVDSRHWQDVLGAVISAQNDDGGFGYTIHLKSTASMTVAGIAALQVCAAQLEPKALAGLKVERRLVDAWRWMADHKGQIGDRKSRHCFYFHYGLERAGILSDVIEVAGKDWYESGAEMLLRMQMSNGGWHSSTDMIRGRGEDGADSVSIAFAVLFLRRKFQKTLTTGPVTLGGGIPLHVLGEEATPAQLRSAVATAIKRGVAAMPQVLRALRSPLRIRRQAGAKALQGVAGSDFGYDPERHGEVNRAAIKQAELWYFKARRGAKK